jgi:hypothetical protein
MPGVPVRYLFPRLWKAMDGLTQAHMDVLVACLGKRYRTGTFPQKLNSA